MRRSLIRIALLSAIATDEVVTTTVEVMKVRIGGLGEELKCRSLSFGGNHCGGPSDLEEHWKARMCARTSRLWYLIYNRGKKPLISRLINYIPLFIPLMNFL